MLELFIPAFANKYKEINTLSSGKKNWITKVDSEGLYVETESSRKKYRSGEKPEPGEMISYEVINYEWNQLLRNGTLTANDFTKGRGRSSFLMAFFALFPFVEVSTNNNTIVISEYCG